MIKAISRVSSQIAVFVLFFVAWEVAVDLLHIKPVILPSPTQIFESIIKNWPYLMKHSGPTAFAIGALALFAAIAVLLLTTQRVATAVGIAEPWLTVWAIGRFPVVILLFTLLIAVLYYVTPNVRHERVRWVSFGALFAIVVWGLATAAFTVYVSTVGTYDRVYGWLGGGLALLLWLYITNLVLVLGAEVDAEFVRLRQLRAGIPAEEVVQLPMRDTRRNLMLARQRAQDEAEGREIRDAAVQKSATPPDDE